MVQEQIITNGILKQIISVIFVFVFLVWKPLGSSFSTYLPKSQESGNLCFVPQVKAETIMFGLQKERHIFCKATTKSLKHSLLLVLLFS